MARSLPTTTNKMGEPFSERSQDFWKAPSTSGAPAARYGNSSITTTVGPATRRERELIAASHELNCVSVRVPAGSTLGCFMSSVNSFNSSSLARPLVAVKKIAGELVRSMNSSINRDLPTWRRPRINANRPLPVRPTSARSASSSASCSCLPAKSDRSTEPRVAESTSNFGTSNFGTTKVGSYLEVLG
jgi:hypothetical protein